MHYINLGIEKRRLSIRNCVVKPIPLGWRKKVQKEISILNFQRFRRYVVANAPLERLHTGMMWAEGPVWFADLEILLLSDVPAEQILLFAKRQPPVVFRHPSGNANGNTRDRQGRLLTCESDNRRVVLT